MQNWLLATAALFASLATGFGQSDPDTVLAHERSVLEENPADSLAHFRIGEILVDQKNYQQAANEFREALGGDLQPEWVAQLSHVRLGQIFEITDQYDRASNEFKLASRNKPAAHLKPIETVAPDYADEARLAELEGTVIVSGAIGDGGYVGDLAIVQSLGLGLDQAAVDAVEQWLFEPGASQPGSEPLRENIGVDFIFPAKQSRWHLIGVEFAPPEGASRPVFLSVKYPAGSGLLARDAVEEGGIVAAMGSHASVTLSFEVDENGVPVRFRVVNSSAPVWKNEAIAVVSGWRFRPGILGGRAVSVPCTMQLLWGARKITAESIARFRR